jgi:hypothetical protein
MSQVNTSGKKVSQVINVKEIFGKNINDINLKEKIGQFFIDKMKDRSAKGLDINGNSFVDYSESYTKSIPFQAAGKTKNVNMRLSGDMLGSIDILSINGNNIKIGFADRNEELKAHGHMTGGGKNNNLPVREFFGVSEKEIKQASNKFKDDIQKLGNKK